MLYAADGSLNVTVVDGSELVGAYAPDGSLNVILAPDPVVAPVGLYHPCGAIYVTVASGSSPLPVYAPDGSLYVQEDSALSGPIRVTVVEGSFEDEPAMLAKIDFQAGAYEVDGVSKTLGQMITGGTFNPSSVSAMNGWFPSDDEYGFFGSAMLPVIGRAEGFCVVLHSEAQGSVPQNITLTFANDAFTVAVTGLFTKGPIGALRINDALSDPLIAQIDSEDALGGEEKHAIRVSPDEYAGMANGLFSPSESSVSVEEGQFATWGNQSFVEAGASSYKIYSIEFWTPNKELSELVALA